jgi:ATP-binding cassette subfamily C protein
MILSTLRLSWRQADVALRLKLVVASFLLAAGSVFELVGLSMIFPIVRLLQDEAFSSGNVYVRTLADLSGIDTPRGMVVFVCLILVGLLVLKAIFALSVQFWLSKSLAEAEHDFALGLYGSYLSAPLAFLFSRNTTDLAMNIYPFVGNIFSLALLSAANLLAELVVLVGIVGALFAVDPAAAIGSAVLVALFAVIYRLTFKNHIARLSNDQRTSIINSHRTVVESLSAVSEVKSFAREAFFVNLYDHIRQRYVRTSYLLKTLQLLPRHYVEILGGVGLLFFIAANIDTRENDELIALLAVYGIAALRLMPSATRLITLASDIQRAAPGVRAIHAESDTLIECNLPPIKRVLDSIRSAPPARYAMRNNLEVFGLSYSYDGISPAICGISFRATRGESIGIVGVSGSGKSTLANVLLGLLHQDAGCIRMDGVEIDPASNARQRSMSYVPQKLFLLDDTIRANIAFGVPPENVDEARIAYAIEKAELGDLVKFNPQGAGLIVGERGVRLSGGQMQRLGIARALYNDAEIVVLDEPTSALDVETESRIALFLNALHGEKTLIIIAHRLSTIRQCDQIILLKDGQIGGKGSFESLRERNAEFARMVELASLVPNEILA